MAKRKKAIDTELIVILDRSGSMSSVQHNTIEGYNTFMEEQKKLDGKCNVTMAQFDHEYEMVYDGVPLKEVTLMNAKCYLPRGMTALHDAIGKTVTDTAARLSKHKGQVLFLIVTDGLENSSKEWTKEGVKALMDKHEDWKFVYLGANQDAKKEGSRLGFAEDMCMNFQSTPAGTSALYKGVTESVSCFRETGSYVTTNTTEAKDDS